MDDGIPIGMLLLFLTCLLGSFFFSGAEMAIASVSRVRMRVYAEDGNKRARRVLTILDRFDAALTTILIGNNICNVSAATIATVLATRVWGASSVALTSLCVTLAVFLFAETIPKNFAKACNESFAMAVSGALLLLMKLFRPLVFVFDKITSWVRKPFRRGETPRTVTEGELRGLLEDAVEDGVLDEETGTLVRSAIRYTDAAVRDILTPWKQVERLPLSTPHEAVLAVICRTRHSRLPVVDETGEVVGLLRTRKYLKETLRGAPPASLAEVLEPARSISVAMPVDDLLPAMSAGKTHFVLVRDEWENVLGIVTMEDILERLVGAIDDEEDVEGGEAIAQ